jgi:hypothetical protein
MAEGDGPAPAPAPAKKKSADSSASGMREDVVVVDDEDEAEMKGYKTLSDGRKTSYCLPHPGASQRPLAFHSRSERSSVQSEPF